MSSLFGLYSQILSGDDISTRTLFLFLFNPSSRSVVNAVPSVCPPCNSLHSCRANRRFFFSRLLSRKFSAARQPMNYVSPCFNPIFSFLFFSRSSAFTHEHISYLLFFKYTRPFNIYHPLPGFRDLYISLKGDFRPAAATASSLRIPQLRSSDRAHVVGRLCTFS